MTDRITIIEPNGIRSCWSRELNELNEIEIVMGFDNDDPIHTHTQDDLCNKVRMISTDMYSSCGSNVIVRITL